MGNTSVVTIAGPVDIWTVNVVNLVIDLVFWLLIIEIINMIIERRTP